MDDFDTVEATPDLFTTTLRDIAQSHRRKETVRNFMAESSAYFAAHTSQHSLQSDWFAEQPHPQRFNQGNSQRCIYCGMLIGYSFRGKDYGPDFYQEIALCPQKPI